MEPSTPMMAQYHRIKKSVPGALLFFRLGDFYEMFFDDAVVAARELEITLTSRNKEKGALVPMCRGSLPQRRRLRLQADSQGLPRGRLRSGREPEDRQEAGEAGGDPGGYPRHPE